MKNPQLCLRDLYWLVLVAACLCGWWLEQRRLEKQISVMSAAYQGCGPQFSAGTLTSTTSPPIESVVNAIDEPKGTVQIAIGADDGLKRGQAINVYRGKRLLGGLVVQRAGIDSSLCEIDQRMQRAKVCLGDRVSTK